jgi:hypothetical protein
MANTIYDKEMLIKTFGKGNKQLDVYVHKTWDGLDGLYEVRGVKNKPHENHATVWEILTEGICWTKEEYEDYAYMKKCEKREGL